jgi:tetratricopeptide (TPR) repeat protein
MRPTERRGVRAGAGGDRGRLALLWVAVVCTSAGPASALDSRPFAERITAPLWREFGRPGQRRARDLLEQAMVEVREGNRQLPSDWPTLCQRTLEPLLSDSLAALRGRSRAVRELARQALRKRAHLDNALVRLRRAAELDPSDPQILYALGRVLMLWEQPDPRSLCSSQRRDEEATAVLQKLRSFRPEFMADAVAFDLAVLFTRRARFADAAHAYADAIALSLDGDETAVMRSNLAEVTMLEGDLEQAVEHYHRALLIAIGGRDYLLSVWGLSVALDRLGEHASALQNAQKAVQQEGGHMQVLRSDGVFFEPKHELYYYEALGHEALASRPEADRVEELAAAAASFRVFVAAAGDAGIFTAAARASLERIEAELRVARPVAAPRPAPTDSR